MGGFVSDSKNTAFQVAKVLAEHKASDVVVLDLRHIAGWTDYFVIGSCMSVTQLRALGRFVEEELSALSIQALNKPSIADDQTWLLIDAGDVVIHIMLPAARQFYELEKLWFKAESTRILFDPASLTGTSIIKE
jgi:ribosome-associated protein